MTPTPLDRGTPPEAGSIRPFHLPEVESDALPNGLGLRSMSRDEVPLVSACLVLDAGETGVPSGREGIAVLTGDALQGGTERRSGAELAEALETLGSSVRASTGWDATTLSFTSVAERVDEMLAFLAEMVTRPAFPSDEVERVRRQRLAAIHQRRMEPGQLADDELDREVFGPDHPYCRPLSGREESLEGLDEEAVAAFARENYSPRRGGFVLVGDLSAGRGTELAERHFGDWDPTYVGRRELPLARGREEGSVVLVHRPGAVQSEVRIGHQAPARGHEDEVALRVSNTVLGGAFTSRLNLSLREEHGFTYGAYSRFAFRRNGGAFTIGTAVGTDVTTAALEEALGVFRRFAEDGPSPEELAAARDYLAGVFPLRMETTAQLAARLAELVIFDLPDDEHHRYRERVRAIEPDAAGEAVRRHLSPDRAAVVVVGDADRLGGEFEAAGIGPVEIREP